MELVIMTGKKVYMHMCAYVCIYKHTYMKIASTLFKRNV